MNDDVNRIRKIVWILFSVAVVSFILDVLVQNILLKVLFELICYGTTIAIIVYSIKLIRRKQKAFGIIFLVLASLIILFLVFAFIVGFIIGVISVT